jgi:carboxyl-terminal processing protease
MKTIQIAVVLVFVAILSCKQENAEYVTSFETVWHTVNQTHYDPTFGGLDWRDVHDRYRPQVAIAQNDTAFYTLVNKMLFELNLSHLLITSHDGLKLYLPTLFADGSIGIGIGLLNNVPVITSVAPDSPGEQAGLRPGFILEAIDGVAVEDIISDSEKKLIPPYNSRNRRNNLTLLLLGHIYGPPDTQVSLEYLDGYGRRHSKTIVRRLRGRGRVVSEVLPPFFIEFQARRLEENIGYMWFNHFADPVDKRFISALKSMRDAHGLIIDLRGNSGGFITTLDAISKYLLLQETTFSVFKFRDKTIHNILTPAKDAFKGPVVVLINVTSLSGSEIFASSLQAIGRATIVGEQSPGYSLLASWMRVPNGAAFMHTIAQNLTPDGRAIEDQGVVPDLEVELDRKELLQGRDAQLQAAIDYLRSQEPGP